MPKILINGARPSIEKLFIANGFTLEKLEGSGDYAFPVPYNGYFYYNGKQINVSEYSFAVIFNNGASIQKLYQFINGIIPIYGNPTIRSKFDNKFSGPLIVSKNGVPVPPFINGTKIEAEFLSDFGDKIVRKPVNTSNGDCVELINNPEDLNDEGPQKTSKLIFQKFIDCGAKDERWIIVGDKIVSAMERSAVNENEFRANIHVGGKGRKIEITQEMQDFAKKIIEPFPGFIYAGIDILKDKNGNRYFLEANSVPGEHIIKVTGYNYPKDVVDYILNLYEKDKK